MPDRPNHRHRFSAVIIVQAVWLYHRFALSLRDVEELLYERGIVVTCETVRAWVAKFGARYAAELRKRAAKPGRTWHMDEVFTRVRGQQVYLWRAVDEHGQVLDVLVQEHRDTAADECFFRRLLGHAGGPPDQIVTDSLASYGAAKARLPERAAVEHRRVREYVTRRFESVPSAQQFPTVFSGTCHHFRLRRRLLTAGAHRAARHARYATWRALVASATAAETACDAPEHRSARLSRS